MDAQFWLIFGGCLALCVVYFAVAMTNTVVGKVFRWFWNIGFRLFSFFPFCGWCAYFIIAKTPEEKAMKAKAIGSADSAQGFYEEQLNNVAKEQQRQEEREAKIRKEMAARGYETVSINYDQSTTVGKDKHGNTYNVKVDWD